MGIQEEAHKWIDNLQSDGGLYGSWRLQVLEQKSRVVDKETGEMKLSPVRLRRFAKGIPRPLVDEAIRYLVGLAPYTGMLYDGVPCQGTFVPVRTRWLRDDDVTVERKHADNRYTIIQDLVEIDELDTLGTVTSESCSETVTTDYVWDAATIEPLPDDAGMQGVTYSVQGVSRDSDGNISYAVVRRVSRTTVSGPVVAECDEYGSTVVTVWDNVYGEGTDDDPFREGPEAMDLGISARTPPCEHARGTTVTEQVTRNEDCTYRIVHTEKVSNSPVTTEHSESSTIYENVETDTVRAATIDSDDIHVRPDAPDRSAGTVNDVKVELRPDGLYDVVDKVRTERPVENSEVEKRKTLRGVRTTVRNRHQEDPLPDDDLALGETVRNTKTDSGRYDTVHEQVDAEPVGTIQADHRGTIFQDSFGVKRNDPDSYFSRTDGVFKDGHDHVVNDGVIKDVSSTATEEGTFDNDRTVTTEHNREYSEIEYRKTLRASRKTITHRNRHRNRGDGPVDESLAEGDVLSALHQADGVLDDDGNLKIELGDRVRLTRTNGDRVDVVIEHVDYADEVGVTGATSQPTKFEVVNTVTGNYPDLDSILLALYPDGDGDDEPDCPADFDWDKWREFMSIGGSGTFELPSDDGTLRSISIQKTDEGTLDVTVTTKTARGDGYGTTWNEQISTPWEYKYSVHFRNVAPEHLFDVLGNFDDITSRRSRQAAYRDASMIGTYSQVAEDGEISTMTTRDNSHRRLVQLWDRGDRPVDDEHGGFVSAADWEMCCPWRETEYTGIGSWMVKPEITVAGNRPNFSQQVSWKLSKWFSGHVDDFFSSYHRGPDGKIDATFNLDFWTTCVGDHTSPPSSHDVSVSLSMNDYGYYDGTAAFTAKWSPESPGQESVLGDGVYLAYRMGNVALISGRGFDTLLRTWNYQHSFMTSLLGRMRDVVEANLKKNESLTDKQKNKFDAFWKTAAVHRLVARGSSLSFDPITKSWHASLNCEGNEITSTSFVRSIESMFIDYVINLPDPEP